MTDSEEPSTKQPDFPEKLAKRIDENVTATDVDDPIIDAGDIELTSSHPVSVVEFFLEVRKAEWADWTFRDYSYDLTRLLEYCDYVDIDDLSQVTKNDIEGFKEWRKRDSHICLATLHGQLANIRVFFRWAEAAELVDEGLADDISMPDIDSSDLVSYVRLYPETADSIIAYYENLSYVSREYAEFLLMWVTLFRLGDVRAIDLDNYNRKEQFIELEHRPDEGTPLKNGEGEVEGEGGEREVNLPDWVCEVLNTYIDGTGDPNHPKRIETTDEFGREPLFTTKNGRISESSLRRDLYQITQPCRHTKDCPQGRNPRSCDARNYSNDVSKCPENVSPHPIRRGGICYLLRQNVSKDTICERADVSRKVLNRHYDLRTKEEARKQRREELQRKLEGYDSPSDSTGQEHWLAQEIPVVADLQRFGQRNIGMVGNPPTKTRTAKGIAGYAAFTVLLGINLGLIGIGIDPVAGELIWEVNLI